MLQVIVVSSILDLLLVSLLFGMTVPSTRWNNWRELCHLNEGWTEETIGHKL
jgi:hypothetical protein